MLNLNWLDAVAMTAALYIWTACGATDWQAFVACCGALMLRNALRRAFERLPGVLGGDDAEL